MKFRRSLLVVALAASLAGCQSKTAPTLVIDSKGSPVPLPQFQGTGSIKGTVRLDGVLPAGTRVTLSIKEVNKSGFGFHAIDDGGSYSKALDLKAPASTIPFEVNDLTDGSYRIKAIAYVDLKSRLSDPSKQSLGPGDYAGVYTGEERASRDVEQAKPLEVKAGQSAVASFTLEKI